MGRSGTCDVKCSKTQLPRLVDMVKQFREACKAQKFDVNDKDTRIRMMNLLIEEFEEFYREAGFGFNKEGDPILIKDCEPEKMFHELVDMMYILIDWALTNGWNLDLGFAMVHEANMTKVDPKEGITINAAGKIQKPVDFEPANLNNVVGDEE